MSEAVLYWLRHDLRITDNPALLAAAAKGPVIAVYILDDSMPYAMGGASRWWLYHSLIAIKKDLEKYGVPLLLRRGPAKKIIPALAHETGAKTIYWNRVYEPAAIQRDTDIKTLLKKEGFEVESFNASLLFEPWTIKNKSGTSFKVFTPFSKTCLAVGAAPPMDAPKKIIGATMSCPSDSLESWGLHPSKPDWSPPLAATWDVGEKAAEKRLKHFMKGGLSHYADGRDRPDKEYTSRLSPHLHFGEIGPRQAFQAAWLNEGVSASQRDKFISELLWREFSYHLLHNFPTLPEAPLNSAFSEFPWQDDETLFRAWSRGQTGYPIIDAGMRQLWQTGWMHNRVRMIVASFLVKNLLLPWQKGATWFWDTLVDADLASNSASWQWVAGCGADAAPYFRIFNPLLQGQKFDPEGDYVRRYVPALKNLPPRVIHAPWEADKQILEDSGVKLGENYPLPIVQLAASRERALAAYARIKNS